MMTKNDPNEEVSSFEIFEKSKIYSQGAIMGFSVVFTTIFGGVLLMQNLKEAGKKKEAYTVLIASIVYTLVVILLTNIIAQPNSSMSFALNIGGGALLSKYFFAKHFPDKDKYESKPIWKPLVISIIITIPFVLALIYA